MKVELGEIAGYNPTYKSLPRPRWWISSTSFLWRDVKLAIAKSSAKSHHPLVPSPAQTTSVGRIAWVASVKKEAEDETEPSG
jgi:hypothetical protein